MSRPTARELLDALGGSNEGPWVSASLEMADRVEAVIHACQKGASAATILLILDGHDARIDGPEGDCSLRSGPDPSASEVPRG